MKKQVDKQHHIMNERQKMSGPKVSVLMGIYNNEASVEASIRSIVDQSFRDWEMILINDASTDGSLPLLLKWQDTDSRIKVFSNSSNLGLAASLNKALEESSGSYIARMDGDDVAIATRLKKQVDFLDRNAQYAMVSVGCFLFDDVGRWGTRIGKARPQKRDFLWGSQFLHPGVMMRREALISVDGYRVCKETLRNEDYDLFMRMYAKGHEGYNLEEPLLHYFEERRPKHVKYTFRLNEAKIRIRGFRELGLLRKGWPYVFKPLLVGLIPGRLKRRLQKRFATTKKGDER